jgi:hypothetical protein
MQDINFPSADESTESYEGLARLCTIEVDLVSRVTLVPIRRTAHAGHEVEMLQGSSHSTGLLVARLEDVPVRQSAPGKLALLGRWRSN